jgi:hypothetical protein
MFKADQTVLKVPRCHYYPHRYDVQKFLMGSILPGHLLLQMTRVCAPNAATTRETLLALSERFPPVPQLRCGRCWRRVNPPLKTWNAARARLR